MDFQSSFYSRSWSPDEGVRTAESDSVLLVLNLIVHERRGRGSDERNHLGDYWAQTEMRSEAFQWYSVILKTNTLVAATCHSNSVLYGDFDLVRNHLVRHSYETTSSKQGSLWTSDVKIQVAKESPMANH